MLLDYFWKADLDQTEISFSISYMDLISRYSKFDIQYSIRWLRYFFNKLISSSISFGMIFKKFIR